MHPYPALDPPIPHHGWPVPCLGFTQGPSWMHPCPVLDPPKACPGSTPTVCRIHQSRCWNRLSPGMRTSRVRRGCTRTVVWMRRRTGCPPAPVGGSPRSRSCIGPRHGTRGPVALHRRACGEGWIDPCLSRVRRVACPESPMFPRPSFRLRRAPKKMSDRRQIGPPSCPPY